MEEAGDALSLIQEKSSLKYSKHLLTSIFKHLPPRSKCINWSHSLRVGSEPGRFLLVFDTLMHPGGATEDGTVGMDSTPGKTAS